VDKRKGKRWAILLSALVATLIAIFYPADDGSIAAVEHRPAGKRQLPPKTGATPNKDLADWPPVAADPFAPRGWQAPPAQTVAPSPVATVNLVPETPPAPVGPPPLPFQFVGRMNDDAGQVVYLGRGDQALIAHAGEVLEGTYKVLEITATQMEFEHMPTGQKQTLTFPARDN